MQHLPLALFIMQSETKKKIIKIGNIYVLITKGKQLCLWLVSERVTVWDSTHPNYFFYVKCLNVPKNRF